MILRINITPVHGRKAAFWLYAVTDRDITAEEFVSDICNKLEGSHFSITETVDAARNVEAGLIVRREGQPP